MYYRTDRFDAALEHFRQVISYNPQHAQAYYYIGAIHADREDWIDALDMFTRAYDRAPDNLDALRMMALVNVKLGNHQAALEQWEVLAQKFPQDWEIKTRMIQSLHAVGDVTKREQLRRELYNLRAKGSIPSLVEAEMYVREVFEVPERGYKVYVLEYFELVGDWAKKYRFMIYDAASMQQIYEISIGSYEMTTSFAREFKEIGEDDRLYHMDGYCDDNSHVTYGFYLNEPEYDTVRGEVWEILTTDTISCAW